MPLVIDDTAGGPNANAYTDVPGATEYASYRVGGDAFLDLTEDQQVQALVTAARDIDTLGPHFIGDRQTETQAMEWPRDAGTIPDRLVRANIELAMSYAPAYEDGAQVDVLNPVPANGNIREETTGPLTTAYFEPKTAPATGIEVFPPAVQRLLEPLLHVPTEGWGGTARVWRGS